MLLPALFIATAALAQTPQFDPATPTIVQHHRLGKFTLPDGYSLGQAGPFPATFVETEGGNKTLKYVAAGAMVVGGSALVYQAYSEGYDRFDSESQKKFDLRRSAGGALVLFGGLMFVL